MPAGVSLSRYLSFSAAALFSMFLGSQAVHLYYKPLQDMDELVAKEKERIMKATETNQT